MRCGVGPYLRFSRRIRPFTFDVFAVRHCDRPQYFGHLRAGHLPDVPVHGVLLGRQIQNSAYLRSPLVEGMAQQELKTLLRELHDRAVEGTLGPQSPPPDNYGPTGRLWEPHKYVPTSESAMDWHPANATAEEKARAAAEERDSASLSPWPSNGRPENGPAMRTGSRGEAGEGVRREENPDIIRHLAARRRLGPLAGVQRSSSSRC